VTRRRAASPVARTVLNGAQGISEIIAQVIGQAGPALEMAREALARTKNGATPPPAA
jgi:hypothetical protein